MSGKPIRGRDQRTVEVIPIFADERRKLLIAYLEKHERASVKDLSKELQVSEATLRTDLNLLEEEGIVRRIHGGAVLSRGGQSDFSYSARVQRNRKEKAAIGLKAMDLIQDGQCILIDASTTALELAKCLKKQQIHLTVVTSGIYTALELKENPGIHVILIGGALRMGSAAVEGTLGAEILDRIKVEQMFTSPAGFTLDSGLMDFNIYEVELKRKMVQASSRIVAMMDSSKLGMNSIGCYARTEQISTFITDAGIRNEDAAMLQEQGIRLYTVQP